MTEFANIELALIAPSLTNPRKNFNPTKLAELAEDIKRRGIDTPITVRPLPGSRVADTDRTVQFELVCGERHARQRTGGRGLMVCCELVCPWLGKEMTEPYGKTMSFGQEHEVYLRALTDTPAAGAQAT